MRQFLVFWSTEGSGAQRSKVGLTPPSGSMNFAHFEHFAPQRAQNVQNPAEYKCKKRFNNLNHGIRRLDYFDLQFHELCAF